jgi:hypothetical protein
MQIETSGCSLTNTSKIEEKRIADIYPYVNINRLIFNEKYVELVEKYDSLGMDIPASEMVEKYTKLSFGLNCRSGFSYTRDVENPNWCIVEFQEIDHLLDISYEDLSTAILKAYGIK